jgi:hypothetical protein
MTTDSGSGTIGESFDLPFDHRFTSGPTLDIHGFGDAPDWPRNSISQLTPQEPYMAKIPSKKFPTTKRKIPSSTFPKTQSKIPSRKIAKGTGKILSRKSAEGQKPEPMGLLERPADENARQDRIADLKAKLKSLDESKSSAKSRLNGD